MAIGQANKQDNNKSTDGMNRIQGHRTQGMQECRNAHWLDLDLDLDLGVFQESRWVGAVAFYPRYRDMRAEI